MTGQRFTIPPTPTLPNEWGEDNRIVLAGVPPEPAGIETPIDTPVPLIYGRRKVAVQVLSRTGAVYSYGENYEEDSVAVCLGPIDSIVGWYHRGDPTPITSGAGTIYSYSGVTTISAVDLGSLGKTPYPGVVTATIRKGIYSTYAGIFDNALRIAADVKGTKVYDPRTGLTAWSDNPALCAADFLCSTRYGRGVAAVDVDWQSVHDAADWCDELVGGVRRFTLNLALGKSATVAEVEALVLAHFGARWQRVAGLWTLTTRSPRSMVAVNLSETAGDLVGTPRLTRGSFSATGPNRILVEYLPTDGVPALAYAQTTAVGTTETARTGGPYRLHGLKTVDEAKRAASLLLDSSVLDLTVDVDLMPAYIDLQVGDLVHITHPTALPSGADFVVSSVGRQDQDRVTIRAVEWASTSYIVGSGNFIPTGAGSWGSTPGTVPYVAVDKSGFVIDAGERNMTPEEIGAAPAGHNHDAAYAALSHTHTLASLGAAASGHDHAGVYAPASHNHSISDLTRGNVYLDGNHLYLRASDSAHGIAYNSGIDGPAIDGWQGAGVYSTGGGSWVAKFLNGGIDLYRDANLSGSVLRVNGTQVVGARCGAIGDPTGTGDGFDQVRAILAALRAHGLIG